MGNVIIFDILLFLYEENISAYDGSNVTLSTLKSKTDELDVDSALDDLIGIKGR